MNLTRSVVELPGDGVEVILGEPGQVHAFGQVLPQESIGVLVVAALPGASGSAKNTETPVISVRRLCSLISLPWS